MPRYYRRRYTKIVRPKKKWASNLRQILSDNLTLTSSAPLGYTSDLVTNSSPSATPTPVIIKTGNFKVQGDVHIGTAGGTAAYMCIYAYVIFVPEGFNVTTGVQIQDAINKHPEWIMCAKLLNTSGAGAVAVDSFTMSSRLKRNLNSGDKVVFAMLATTNSSSNVTMRINTQAQFWTCTN